MANQWNEPSEEELRKRLQEEELQAEMEFAPHDASDQATLLAIPVEEAFQAEPETPAFLQEEPEAGLVDRKDRLSETEFFETNTFQDPRKRPTQVSSAPAAPAVSAAAASAAAASAGRAGESPVKPEKEDIAAMETAQVPRESADDPDDYDDDEYEEEPEEEEEPVDRGRLVRIILGIAIGVVLLAILMIYLLSRLLGGGVQESSSSKEQTSVPAVVESSVEESLPVESSAAGNYQTKSLSGVILNKDASKENITVYSADTGEERTFDLTEASLITDMNGNTIPFDSLSVGDPVDVTYLLGDSVRVQRVKLSSEASTVRDVTGAEVNTNTKTVRYRGHMYHFDGKLLCLYQGREYDPADIDGLHVFNMTVVGDHIYVIRVSRSVGTVVINYIEELKDATIRFTSDSGSREAIIQPQMDPIMLVEGFQNYTVTKEGRVIAEGSVFVTANERKTLTITPDEERKGRVDVIVTPSGADAKIFWNGEEQSGTEIEAAYGEYLLRVEAEGYEPVEQTVTLNQSYMRVEVQLKAKDMTVLVTSSLWGTGVYCDGEYVGTCQGDAVEFHVDPGRHTLVLTNSGYEDYQYTFTVNAGSSGVLNLYFSRFIEIITEPSSSIEESSAEESSAEESSREESSAEESSREESSAEESSQEESSAEESSAEESSAEESSVEESSAEESSAEESSAEESSAEESSAEESSAEESSAEESSAEESSAEESSAEDSPEAESSAESAAAAETSSGNVSNQTE